MDEKEAVAGAGVPAQGVSVLVGGLNAQWLRRERLRELAGKVLPG